MKGWGSFIISLICWTFFGIFFLFIIPSVLPHLDIYYKYEYKTQNIPQWTNEEYKLEQGWEFESVICNHCGYVDITVKRKIGLLPAVKWKD